MAIFLGDRVGPDDPRYAALRTGFNQRWVGCPAYVQLAGDTDQVARAVQDALDGDHRVTVRSGGHCYEDFVTDHAGVVVDLSPMNQVGREPDGAFCLDAGCAMWNVYEQLYSRYGVTVPGGVCYSVGLGGHLSAGGYGMLSRKFGLASDHLTAVEVVTVDADRRARVVKAAANDPETADLVWAHTGGGGGNFGVATRFWFDDLPAPPPMVYLSTVSWQWSDLAEGGDFERLLTNYGTFLAAHSAPDSPFADLHAHVELPHASAGTVGMTVQLARDDPSMLLEFLDAVNTGLTAQPQIETRRMPWLHATQTLNLSGPNRRGKYKSAYMAKPFPDHHIAAIKAALTDPAYNNPEALLEIHSYGCVVNGKSPEETAQPHRSSIMKLQYQTYWTDPAEDDHHLAWIRTFYRSVYCDEPMPDGIVDGCYAGYPDVDLRRWETLYYKDNYARLQRVKRRWDPLNVFRHAQSIR